MDNEIKHIDPDGYRLVLTKIISQAMTDTMTTVKRPIK